MKAFIKVNNILRYVSQEFCSIQALDTWLVNNGVIIPVEQLKQDIQYDNVWYFIED
jgi:hypothetical protein